jgi:predicted Zn-dependent peptidase
MTVKRTVLPSGLRIVTEEVSEVRSAAIGVWVNVGSRDEDRKSQGASHFLEHLLFKGTETRSALDISSAIEAVGGEMNAFTSKEYTCYYARVIDSDLPIAIDVIADLITSSLCRSEDVDAERKVVLEEISMRDDDPSDLVHEVFAESFYGKSSLGRSILGSEASIRKISRDSIYSYYREKYRPHQMVISIAGNIKHKKVVAAVESAMARGDFLASESAPEIRSAGTVSSNKSQVGLLWRKSEQAHLFLGVPSVARDDSRRFAVGVLSAALGGGMSSRAFQEVREKRGLAYSVYSYAQQFSETGHFGFYAGTSPEKSGEVVSIFRELMSDVAKKGLTQEELQRAQGAVRGSLVLSQEDTGSRMSRIGKSELVYGHTLGFDQILRQISSVNSDDIKSVASEILNQSPTLAVVGPFKSTSKFEKLLA